MRLQIRMRKLMLAACAALAMTAGAAHAQEIPLVNGQHWTTSTDAMKKAYLIGIANAIQVEVAYGGATPAADAQSVIPRMAKGLKNRNHTLDTVREGLDRYYAVNPDKLQRPVIEVIWFEMVVPGLKS
ncbi:MAG: hypothetical protein U1F15_15015 [Burkholderiales bacterium]